MSVMPTGMDAHMAGGGAALSEIMSTAAARQRYGAVVPSPYYGAHMQHLVPQHFQLQQHTSLREYPPHPQQWREHPGGYWGPAGMAIVGPEVPVAVQPHAAGPRECPHWEPPRAVVPREAARP